MSEPQSLEEVESRVAEFMRIVRRGRRREVCRRLLRFLRILPHSKTVVSTVDPLRA